MILTELINSMSSIHLNTCFSPLMFVFQALLRESWLDDMMSVLTESVVPTSDVHAVNAATKRHEAITADVMARVGAFFQNIIRIKLKYLQYYFVNTIM